MNHFATPPVIPSNGCSCLYHKIIPCVSEIPIELGVLIALVSPNPAALREEGPEFEIWSGQVCRG